MGAYDKYYGNKAQEYMKDFVYYKKGTPKRASKTTIELAKGTGYTIECKVDDENLLKEG